MITYLDYGLVYNQSPPSELLSNHYHHIIIPFFIILSCFYTHLLLLFRRLIIIPLSIILLWPFFSLQAVIAYIYLFSFDILLLYLHNNILTLLFYYFFLWNIFYITFSRIYILYKKIFFKNNLLKMQSWPPKNFYIYQNAVLTPPKTCLRTVCYKSISLDALFCFLWCIYLFLTF